MPDAAATERRPQHQDAKRQQQTPEQGFCVSWADHGDIVRAMTLLAGSLQAQQEKAWLVDGRGHVPKPRESCARAPGQSHIKALLLARKRNLSCTDRLQPGGRCTVSTFSG